jgi:hypothetical protein
MKLKNVEIFLKRKYSKEFSFIDNRNTSKPLTELKKPLSASKLAFITSGGFYKNNEEPFDTETLLGDITYRIIGKKDTLDSMGIAHTHYDHQFVKEDINTVYPMELLQNFIDNETIGSLADNHYSFCGFVLDTDGLINNMAKGILQDLRKENVDVVLLAPV